MATVTDALGGRMVKAEDFSPPRGGGICGVLRGRSEPM